MADVRRHRTRCLNPAPQAQPPSPSQQPAPSEELKRVDVVHFPANGFPPRIVSVSCRIQTSTRHHGLQEEWAYLRHLLDDSLLLCGAIGRIRRSSAPPSRLYLALSTQSSSPENLCVRRYTEGHNGAVWTGNIVGFRRREPITKYMQYIDITERDISAFVTYFREFGTPRVPATPESFIVLGSVL